MVYKIALRQLTVLCFFKTVIIFIQGWKLTYFLRNYGTICLCCLWHAYFCPRHQPPLECPRFFILDNYSFHLARKLHVNVLFLRTVSLLWWKASIIFPTGKISNVVTYCSVSVNFINIKLFLSIPVISEWVLQYGP